MEWSGKPSLSQNHPTPTPHPPQPPCWLCPAGPASPFSLPPPFLQITRENNNTRHQLIVATTLMKMAQFYVLWRHQFKVAAATCTWARICFRCLWSRQLPRRACWFHHCWALWCQLPRWFPVINIQVIFSCVFKDKLFTIRKSVCSSVTSSS